MICPIYKNKKVRAQFNEIIEALGGRPMTEQEFGSVDLRSQRNGLDYSAMEAAYRIWNLNNGNPIDYTPNTKEDTKSILFQNLLDLYSGDRAAAIRAKSNVYSKAFRGWFGDWTEEDKENVSKVVDANGEPLIVYHGNRTDLKIKEFDKSKIGSEHKKIIDGFWFITDKRIAEREYSVKPESVGRGEEYLQYGETLPVYLNIKNPKVETQGGLRTGDSPYGRMPLVSEQFLDFIKRIQDNAENNDGFILTVRDSDGDADPFYLSIQTQIIVKNPNQIKHAVLNKGTFSKQDANIYNLEITSDASALAKSDFSQTFGNDIYNRLLAGEQVSSQELLEAGINDKGVFGGKLYGMARMLMRHDIPVIVGESMSDGTVATTLVNENGQSAILINPDWINNVSKRRQGEIIIHEIIHAVVSNALISPSTVEEQQFNKKTHKIFNQLKNAVKNEDWHLFDVYGGLYALYDVHEFVSEFVSNGEARANLYALAQEIDQKGNNKAVLRLKYFVNSLFRLFVNKSLFSTEKDNLRQYERYLQDYLNDHNSVKNTQPINREELIAAYKSIDKDVLSNDVLSYQKEKLHKAMVSFHAHNVRLGYGSDETLGSKDTPIKDKYNWVKNSLQSRIQAIQTSRLPQNTKTVLISETKGWLNQVNNPQVSTYESFSQLLNAFGPRIIQALDELDELRLKDVIDPSDYMFQAHDNIGTFDKILSDISSILKNESEIHDIINQYNEQNEESQITKNNIVELQSVVEELSGLLSTAKGIITNLNNRIAIKAIGDTVRSAGSIEGMEMLENMVSRNPVVEQDISWFQVHFGQADASPSEIVRAVAHIIQKANDRIDDMTLDKAIELIRLSKNLKDGESVLDLYEVVNGKRTGFLVRRYNYGKYRNEYEQYMAELNKQFGLAPKNTIPPTDEESAIEWELRRQDFISSHGNQKYKPEYYKAWASVPRHVKEQLGKINGAMTAILQKYNAIDDDGTRHYEKITDDDAWRQFLQLKMTKRLMRETHDRFGNEKQGTDLQDALSLQNVYKQLYGDKYVQLKTRKAQWQKARNKIIEQCGGQKELDKYLKGEESTFDFATFDKWESRNTKYDFKRDSNGKPIVFDDLEQEMHGMKIDYGEEYKQLKKRERDLLRPIYDVAGEPNPELLEDSIKNIINNEIHPKLAEIRKKVIQNTPGYAKLAEASKRLFDVYFKFVDTRYYRDIQKNIDEELMSDVDYIFDDNDFEMALSEYGTLYEEDGFFYTIPYKWYQTLRAKDDNYMEPVPNEAWLEPDDSRNYDNPVWKEQQLDKEGLSVVPKYELYKNDQWEKIENSPTLKALYDAILQTMHEANEMQSNRQFTNDWQLPGVSGKLFDRLSQVKGFDKLKVFLRWACEKLGINIGQDQDVLLRGETTVHDEDSVTGDTIYSQFTRVVGRRGDGREYTALPQYFTRRLDNPEFTSKALLDIVLSYYKMAANYHEKSKIKDQCDAILDYVKTRGYKPGMSQTAKNEIEKALNIKGADSTEMSNVYKQLKNLIDFGLYGKVMVQFKTKWFDFNRVLDVTRQLTTATNLGMNKKVAAVGFLTAMHCHIVNSLVGKEYNFINLVTSAIEVTKHIVNTNVRYNTYGRRSEDLVQVVMEQFGIANQLERKMTDLDFPDTRIGEIRRMVKQNYVFGYLATIDYLTKSQITVSTLKNYKYINGEIYSNVDIQYMRHDKENYKKLYAEYKKAKPLYSYMKVRNGKVYFEDAKMQKAWDQEFSRIKAKCVKMSERADGVATGLQRAAIQNSWIGMIIMIHRQFLPLMLQERYGDRVYDYDTQEYKNGQFRVMFKYLSELMMNNLLAGLPTAMIALSFFISNPAWIIGLGAIISTGMRIYGKTQHKNESIKDINKRYFNTFDDQKSTINSLENRWALKQIAIERGLIFLISNLLVAPVCKWADDDKDDWFLQTIAYWLKGSQWEINGPYNIEELIANIKSPTPMTSLLDRFNGVAANGNSGLLQWLSYLSLTEEDDKIINKNSPYAGWTHAQRAWFKALAGPVSNELEQDDPRGAYGKRHWMERQNFHEKSGSNRDIYEETRNLFNIQFE